MGLTTKYFTNASNFEGIVEALRTAEGNPDQIDKNYLKHLGYTDPSDELILNFLKTLKYKKENNTPTPLLEKFEKTAITKEVIAYGILEAYGTLFEVDPTIHQKPKEEIIGLIQSTLEEDKSSIIINYMANTFKVLVDFSGHEMITKILNQKNSDVASQKEQGETGKLKNESENDVEKSSEEVHISQSVTKEQETEEQEEELELVEQEEEPVTEEKESVDKDKELVELEQEVTNSLNDNDEVSSMSLSISALLNGEKGRTKKEEPKTGLTKFGMKLPATPEFEVTNEENKTAHINKAYISKAELLYKLDRFEEALPALDKVYQRFAKSDELELYKVASVALIKKMDTAEKLELMDYLIPIYSTVIDRLSNTEENDFTPFIDHAYLNVIDILIENGQIDAALKISDQAIIRFKKMKRNSDLLLKMVSTKAELLEQSGSDLEALEAFDEILKNFANSTK
jgi:tetratricopeptide (TPR) repeat protein